ncbi:hypothetical protein [Kutzneria sp. 744]|uniref:hypothetical protein n=1 Tax=Kutzneria sp. (strain 744) TaxID=345341 RepID=UPI0018DE18CB|nr:hypothetical protein [Kutzneria sp. 744]
MLTYRLGVNVLAQDAGQLSSFATSPKFASSRTTGWVCAPSNQRTNRAMCWVSLSWRYRASPGLRSDRAMVVIMGGSEYVV